MERNVGGSGKDPSGASPALTTSDKPCSRSSSVSPLRAGQICSIGWVLCVKHLKLEKYIISSFLSLIENIYIHLCSRSTTHKGTRGSSSTLCPWSSSVPSLSWTWSSVCSAGEQDSSFCFVQRALHTYLSLTHISQRALHIFQLRLISLSCSESSQKRRRRLSLAATSNGCERSSKWRRTFKDMLTGSLKLRSWKPTRKPMLYRWSQVSPLFLFSLAACLLSDSSI